MTVTHRKRQYQPEEIQTVSEPGLQIECDSCACDLTHSIRIKCADPACESGDGVDICPACFCAGKEFGNHKRGHAYRVVELHSYPIFVDDWGADEELLLLEGITLQGLGNWQAISEHVGTRTKEEVEQHYYSVYVESPNWPLPRMDVDFDIDPAEFQERKRRRISSMTTNAPPPHKVAPVSAPGVHEVATFLPGRLEFEHELDNEAEDIVKDLEFGICLEWGGDQIPEDENDVDVKARIRWEEEMKAKDVYPGKRLPNGLVNGMANGYHSNGDTPRRDTSSKPDDEKKSDDAEDGDEQTQPPPIETKESLTFKLTLLESYYQRVDKRLEAKSIMFDRGLLNYKQMQAADKKRSKEEKDILHRLRPFARLQTAEDFEQFQADILYEHMLRKRIKELQLYRTLGLRTPADIEKYEADFQKRAAVKNQYAQRDYFPERRLGGGRASSADPRRVAGEGDDREGTPKPSISGTGPPSRKMPAPLNLANSPSLHLLTPEEQTLCSALRIMPKPYLVIKETLVREYARRGGKLRRREARELVKLDVNKVSRVWDFLVQAGYLQLGSAVMVATAAAAAGGGPGAGAQNQGQAGAAAGAGVGAGAAGSSGDVSRLSATPSLSTSPSKDSQARVSPRPPPFTTVPLGSASSSQATLPTLGTSGGSWPGSGPS
ncbi:SWIRM-domain-containing protein [Lentinus brumalis]|uniref:SWIRM-domain-containing protein n=1 Tax=Lentinus brumalis TaxID=2498619 RepID=A0A371DR04_9APHY|nr:SWIRM-domain-containing protein [Polyporus brumalis]